MPKCSVRFRQACVGGRGQKREGYSLGLENNNADAESESESAIEACGEWDQKKVA